MPVPKKKDTTAATAMTASETPDFHQHLRALIRSATRIVMEEVMREELEQFIGAGWRECSLVLVSTSFMTPLSKICSAKKANFRNLSFSHVRNHQLCEMPLYDFHFEYSI